MTSPVSVLYNLIPKIKGIELHPIKETEKERSALGYWNWQLRSKGVSFVFS